MLQDSPAQDILKRLIDAEQQANQILAEAEQRANDEVQRAHEEAQKLVNAVRQDAADRLRVRLAEVESASAAQLKQRLDDAIQKASDFEAQAAQNLSAAADLVVEWVTGRAS